MSDTVCFQNNERIHCADVCSKNDFVVVILVCFSLVFMSLLYAVCTKKAFSFWKQYSSATCTNHVNQEIQCNIDCGMRTLTINPDNSVFLISDVDETNENSLFD